MPNLKIVLVVSFLFFQAQNSAAEIIRDSEFFTPTWGGAAYIDVSTGRFSHCSISTLYANSDSLTIAEYADGKIQLGIQTSSLSNFKISENFLVGTRIDTRDFSERFGQIIFENFLIVGPFERREFLKALKQGNVLTLSAPRWQRNFSLYGTFKALEAANNCVQRNFNFVKNDRSHNAGTMVPLNDKTLAYQLATSMIARSGLSDFQYMTQNELDERNWNNAVAWNAAGGSVTGVILTAELQGERLRDSDDDDILFLVKDCSGDYATLTRQVDAAEDFEVREIMMKCVIDDRQGYVTYLTKTLLGKIIIYQVFIVRNSFQRENWDSEEFRDDITVASTKLLGQYNQ